MIPLKQYLNRRLTTLETVVILLIAAALAWAGYWGYQFTVAKVLEARVDAALPKICEHVREERGKLASAIEAYKAHFGTYPPDHVISRRPMVVDPLTNTLFYELVGVIYNPTNKMFQAGGTEVAEEQYVKEYFQVDSFRNCAETENKITNFLKIDPPPAHQLHDDPDVFAVGFPLSSEEISPQVFWEIQTSPWRYVSSSPTNNPGQFDLWIELKTKSRKIVIGNWKAVE